MMMPPTDDRLQRRFEGIALVTDVDWCKAALATPTDALRDQGMVVVIGGSIEVMQRNDGEHSVDGFDGDGPPALLASLFTEGSTRGRSSCSSPTVSRSASTCGRNSCLHACRG
jgi:hypothetical protein